MKDIVHTGTEYVLLCLYFTYVGIIAKSSLEVFDACPSEEFKKENSENKTIARSSVALNIIFIVIFLIYSIYCLIVNEKAYKALRIILVDITSVSAFEVFVKFIMLVCFVGGFVLTVLTEFSAVETIEKCDYISVTNPEDIKKFEKEGVIIQRMYGVNIMVIVLYIAFIINVISE